MRGSVLIVAAPSGAGKSSLVNAMLALEPGIRLSISSTTRPPRPGEDEGQHYHFVSRDAFESQLAAGAFLEHAEVHGNWYGTSRAAVEPLLARGIDVLLEIDWQGARQVRRTMPGCLSIFILPPSRLALEERLRNRRTDADEVIARRLRDAVGDMSHWAEFDYVVVNDDFERATDDLARIIDGRAEDLRAPRPALEPLLAELLA